jgi:hypothetical protein
MVTHGMNAITEASRNDLEITVIEATIRQPPATFRSGPGRAG